MTEKKIAEEDLLEIPLEEEDNLLRILEEEDRDLPSMLSEEEENYELPMLQDDDLIEIVDDGSFSLSEVLKDGRSYGPDIDFYEHGWKYGGAKGADGLDKLVILPNKTLSEMFKESIARNGGPSISVQNPGKNVEVGKEGYGILNVKEDRIGQPSEVSFCFGIGDRTYLISMERDFHCKESVSIFSCTGNARGDERFKADMHAASKTLKSYNLAFYFPSSIGMLERGDKE